MLAVSVRSSLFPTLHGLWNNSATGSAIRFPKCRYLRVAFVRTKIRELVAVKPTPSHQHRAHFSHYSVYEGILGGTLNAGREHFYMHCSRKDMYILSSRVQWLSNLYLPACPALKLQNTVGS
jgi:hypothetical protein